MKRFIALDLETTGLDRTHDEIIEIALVLFEEGVPTREYSRVIRPSVPVRPFILQLTGISAEELEAAPPFAEVIPELKEWIGEEWLVAYNADFDHRFFLKAFEKAGVAPPKNQWLDALVASRTAWPRLPNHKLETLVEHLGLKKGTAHRALPDATWAGEVLLAALRQVSTWDRDALVSLGKLSRGTPWEQFTQVDCSGTLPKWASVPVGMTVSEETPPVSNLPSDEELVGFFKKGWSGHRIAIVEKKSEAVDSSLFRAVVEAAEGNNERWIVVVPTDHLKSWSQALRQEGVKGVIVRRYDRYACRRRLQLFTEAAEEALTSDERQQMMPLLSWWSSAEKEEMVDGESGFNARRNFQLWQKLSSHPAAYPYEQGEENPARMVREKAEEARVVLIDEEFFFHDLQRELALLPRWDHLVVTRAEEIGRTAVVESEKSIRFYRLRNIIQRFVNPWHTGVGLLRAAEKRLPEESSFPKLEEAMIGAEKELHKLLVKLGDIAFKSKSRGAMGYTESLIGAVGIDRMVQALGEIDQWGEASGEIARKQGENDRWFALLSPEFAILKQEIAEFRNDLMSLSEARDPSRIYWIEEWQNPHKLRICAALRSTGQLIGPPLLKMAGSITWIGAPLAARHKLNRFLATVGISPSARLVATDPLEISSPATLLCSATASPGNSVPDTDLQIAMTRQAAEKVAGRVVILVGTSRQAEEWRQKLSEYPERMVFAEGADGYLSSLLRCDTEGRAFIIATDWRSTVSLGKNDLLVLPRIPFAQGRSVYLEQLAADVDRRSKNSLFEVSLPEAALQLRKWLDAHPETPRLVLDHRVITARYGADLRPLWGTQAEVCGEEETFKKWCDSLHSRKEPAQ